MALQKDRSLAPSKDTESWHSGKDDPWCRYDKKSHVGSSHRLHYKHADSSKDENVGVVHVSQWQKGNGAAHPMLTVKHAAGSVLHIYDSLIERAAADKYMDAICDSVKSAGPASVAVEAHAVAGEGFRSKLVAKKAAKAMKRIQQCEPDAHQHLDVETEVASRMAALEVGVRKQVIEQVAAGVAHHDSRLLVSTEEHLRSTSARHSFKNEKPFEELSHTELKALRRGSSCPPCLGPLSCASYTLPVAVIMERDIQANTVDDGHAPSMPSESFGNKEHENLIMIAKIMEEHKTSTEENQKTYENGMKEMELRCSTLADTNRRLTDVTVVLNEQLDEARKGMGMSHERLKGYEDQLKLLSSLVG